MSTLVLLLVGAACGMAGALVAEHGVSAVVAYFKSRLDDQKARAEAVYAELQSQVEATVRDKIAPDIAALKKQLGELAALPGRVAALERAVGSAVQGAVEEASASIAAAESRVRGG